MRFCIIIIALCCISSSTIDKLERFAWNPDKKLQWTDFKAPPDYGSAYAATANTGISHSYAINGKGYYDKENSKVRAHFYPTLSWYRPSDSSETILRHEQAHFDITEIHARKLRKRIQAFNFSSNSQKEVKQLYEAVEEERKAMQQLFDKETNHSRETAQEFIWESKIAKMLLELDEYSYK